MVGDDRRTALGRERGKAAKSVACNADAAPGNGEPPKPRRVNSGGVLARRLTVLAAVLSGTSLVRAHRRRPLTPALADHRSLSSGSHRATSVAPPDRGGTSCLTRCRRRT